ncbi:hypothetical protein F2P79_003065 [Pimephales promelas]|nr:hypothetical protein F2P79_003065 [Pimephales promelas]
MRLIAFSDFLMVILMPQQRRREKGGRGESEIEKKNEAVKTGENTEREEEEGSGQTPLSLSVYSLASVCPRQFQSSCRTFQKYSHGT